jgi:hypothetical protein
MTVPGDVFQHMPAQAYADLRPSVQNGDILLFSQKDGMSRVIEWATKSPWSHIGFVIRLDVIDRIMVLQALPTGVTAVALSIIVNGNGSRAQAPFTGRLLLARHDSFAGLVSAEKLRNMSEFATDRFGAPYANIEIIKIALRVAVGRLNMRMPRLLQADDEYICSEYAAACYERIGITVPWDGLGFIAPSDFAADPRVSAVGVIANAA